MMNDEWPQGRVASWYDFAVAIAEEAAAIGLLRGAPNAQPIRTEDYPTPAQRHSYSVLDKTATWAPLRMAPSHSRVALRVVLKTIKAATP